MRSHFPVRTRKRWSRSPTNLRDADSVADGDDKTLHNQEERRLFYVAMTRARDSLRIYSREGRGKNKTPDGYMRELIENHEPEPVVPRNPGQRRADVVSIFSPQRLSRIPTSRRPLRGSSCRCSTDCSTLSASAVDTYERCGLQFKLERDWRIAGKPAAAMQYGASMHRVLKDLFRFRSRRAS